MNFSVKIKHFPIIVIFLLMTLLNLYAQSVKNMDQEAQKHFENKEFSKAVALWLNILDLDPENAEIQRKIEMLYDMKQRKDIELEKAKFNFRLARKDLIENRDENISLKDAQSNLNESREKASIAFESFVIAYRIDPKDPEMQLLRDEMEKLEKYIVSEDTRLKVTIAQREKADALKALALAAMDERGIRMPLGIGRRFLPFYHSILMQLRGAGRPGLLLKMQ